MSETHDVVIVGGGHNGLVAATLLARSGLRTILLERLDHTGGAAVSERPFAGVDARLSRYSYLVSLMPDELIAELGLQIELRSRDTASYTPYDGGGLLVETHEGRPTVASFREATGTDSEYEAWRAFYGDAEELALAVAPSLLQPLPSAQSVRDQVGEHVWEDLVARPLGRAVERRFTSDLVRGVVATDGLIGTYASLDDDSLLQNRCFLYHLIGNGTGEWRVPVGGMGAVTDELRRVAEAAGADIRTGVTVTSVDAGLDGVTVHADGLTVAARWMLSGVAPYVLAGLLDDPLPTKPRGSQLKINLLVDRLPRLKSGIDPATAFAGTFHLGETYSDLQRAYAVPSPDVACGELYCHTLTDRSILGPELAASDAQTLTYFGIHWPYDAAGPAAKDRGWRAFEAAIDAYLEEPIASVLARDANGDPCVEVKTPADIEQDLAMPGGHIFHGDLRWPWVEKPGQSPAERWGVQTGHARVLVCGSGARRGGAVSGIGGHNAAMAILEHEGRAV
ncbi:NAD(P)/FAD-dependent oxidoreductase [Mumia zhuanghuii]|uniref:Pyridine nucleotide-disulfide oxidoreductase domain-containing protein 2 n=2 Tax=Mumia TaxID=1546255 RepID=A0ABW1QK05_9ACTN|nr:MULTISPECIES: NAD(P)/FAD-dependent oxidoreductase [Mumia]KAA1418128.1 NAD(P)/FAD-dependent oxidoreductase [Mumia zhuanghuii]